MNSPFQKLPSIRYCAIALLIVAVLLPGCGRDNGMPRDLSAHLKAHGIIIQPTRTRAPLSQRGGFLVTNYDAQIAAKLISAFSLKPIAADDPGWVIRARTIGANLSTKEIWGVSKRPPQFKLKDGGQFEYFYLLVTPDGEMYLFAEYAYG